MKDKSDLIVLSGIVLIVAFAVIFILKKPVEVSGELIEKNAPYYCGEICYYDFDKSILVFKFDNAPEKLKAGAVVVGSKDAEKMKIGSIQKLELIRYDYFFFRFYKTELIGVKNLNNSYGGPNQGDAWRYGW